MNIFLKFTSLFGNGLEGLVAETGTWGLVAETGIWGLVAKTGTWGLVAKTETWGLGWESSPFRPNVIIY